MTYHIRVIAPHDRWPVSRVVKRWFSCAHEVECSIFIVVFLFLRDRNYISIKFSVSYSTDSTRTPSGLDKDGVLIVHMDRSTPHPGESLWTCPCGLDCRWTKGGLEVDWKIVNLAGDSTSSPLAVLVQSLWSPHSVLIFKGDSKRIHG